MAARETDLALVHEALHPGHGTAQRLKRGKGEPGVDKPQDRGRSMAKDPERRHVARLTIPPHLSRPSPREEQEVRLVDLSPQGARIEHLRPLADWGICFLDLPWALGGVRIQGKVVWSQAGESKPAADGKHLVHYQTGLTFRFLTPEQRAGLTAALEILRAAREE